MSMETPTRAQQMREAHHTCPLNSAKVVNNNTNISLNGGGGGGGGGGVIRYPTTSNNGGDAMEIPMTPLTPRTISRSEPDPYPTTFVQADTTNFKQVVQMLTGSSETVTKQHQHQQSKQSHQSDPSLSGLLSPSSSKSSIPPIRIPPKRSQQQQGFKLYERRNHSHLKNSLIINTLAPGLGVAAGSSPRNKPEIMSPSMLDITKLALSPVTPLVDPFNNSSSGSGSGSASSPSLGSSSSSSEEERAIAEKGFYLHPSPMSTPRGAEPQLLPLFPITSPSVSGASS